LRHNFEGLTVARFAPIAGFLHLHALAGHHGAVFRQKKAELLLDRQRQDDKHGAQQQRQHRKDGFRYFYRAIPAAARQHRPTAGFTLYIGCGGTHRHVTDARDHAGRWASS